MAACPEWLGQAPSSFRCGGVFRHPRLADARADGRLYCLRRVFWRHFSCSGPSLQNHRPCAHRESDHGYVIGDREALLSFFSDPDKFVAAAPFAFLVVSLIVLIFGAGKISLDAAIALFFGTARVKQANSVPA